MMVRVLYKSEKTECNFKDVTFSLYFPFPSILEHFSRKRGKDTSGTIVDRWLARATLNSDPSPMVKFPPNCQLNSGQLKVVSSLFFNGHMCTTINIKTEVSLFDSESKNNQIINIKLKFN